MRFRIPTALPNGRPHAALRVCPKTALASLACAVLLATVGPARAATVYLADGSQVVGAVQSMRDGELVIETDFAGQLAIPQKKIEGIAADRKLAITLSTGDRIVGAPKYSAEQGQRLTDTAFGEVTLEDASLVAIAPADQPAVAEGEVKQLKQAHQKEVKKLKSKHKKKLKKAKQKKQKRIDQLQQKKAAYEDPWSIRLELGLSGATGNNERLSFDGRAEADRETPDERLNMFAEGHFARDNGERSENEVRGGAKLEVDVSEKTFVFGKTGLEFDEFEDLDLRSRVSAGLGYFFWEKENHVFKGRVGAGYQHESFMNGTTSDQGLLELGYDYRYDFDSGWRFTHNLTCYPTLSDFIGDYRLEVETAGEVPLSDDEIWKLRLGVRNEYDSEPQPGIDKLDTFYFLNFVYDME
jgi:putative salt-induced outer membrane protein YdiY